MSNDILADQPWLKKFRKRSNISMYSTVAVTDPSNRRSVTDWRKDIDLNSSQTALDDEYSHNSDHNYKNHDVPDINVHQYEVHGQSPIYHDQEKFYQTPPQMNGTHCSRQEYESMKHNLKLLKKEKEEMSFQLKNFRDKNQNYKAMLYKEVNDKKSQIKLIKSTHEAYRIDQTKLVFKLQDIIHKLKSYNAALESKIRGECLDNSMRPISIDPLIQSISELQADKMALIEQLMTTKIELENVKRESAINMDMYSLPREHKRLSLDLQSGSFTSMSTPLTSPVAVRPPTPPEVPIIHIIDEDTKQVTALREEIDILRIDIEHYQEQVVDKEITEAENSELKQKLSLLKTRLKQLRRSAVTAENHTDDDLLSSPDNSEDEAAAKASSTRIRRLSTSNLDNYQITFDETANDTAQNQPTQNDSEDHQLLTDDLTNEIIELKKVIVSRDEEYQSEKLKIQDERNQLAELATEKDQEISHLQEILRIKNEEIVNEKNQLTSFISLKEQQIEQIKDSFNKEKEDSIQSQFRQERLLSEKDEELIDMQGELLAARNTISDTLAEMDELVNSKNEEIEFLQEEIQMHHAKTLAMKQVYEDQLNALQSEMDEEIEQVKEDNRQLTLQKQDLTVAIYNTQQKYSIMNEDYKTLKIEFSQYQQFLQTKYANMQHKIMDSIKEAADVNVELLHRYQKEMRLRKKYHNELIELKGNIRVMCRIRPAIDQDGPEPENIISFDKTDDSIINVAYRGSKKIFELDHIFKPNATQVEVFHEVGNLITSCVDGFNVCIFAYGQTGSGKTYTMEGPPDDHGIYQRSLLKIFHEIEERKPHWNYQVFVSLTQIYNESLHDLLGKDPMAKLDIKQKKDGSGLYVPNLNIVEVKCVKDVNNILEEGGRNRTTAATQANVVSSRSHALLCVEVIGTNADNTVTSQGKLNLIDLAGSERVSKSGADGERLKEAQYINKSLSALGDVIHALRNKIAHIPFRNSKLTYLLKDSLSGNSKTLMMVQASPAEKNASETMCSLSFAQRLRTIALGAAQKKTESIVDTSNGKKAKKKSANQ